jgi:hypothetical protein
MQNVDPLHRQCTEEAAHTADGPSWARIGGAAHQHPLVQDLIDIPAWILLGDPGMGKTRAMEALAEKAKDTGGVDMTVDAFIAAPSDQFKQGTSLFLDALDEARASGDKSLWRVLRQKIACMRPRQFAIACRRADWQSLDAEDLRAHSPDGKIRVFTLNPLSENESLALIEAQGIADTHSFFQQATDVGFQDLLGNPKSLELLAQAFKGNGHHLPPNRVDAYALACKELLTEANPRHRSANTDKPTFDNDTLLLAAGFLCALLLLGHCTQIVDDPQDATHNRHVALSDILGHLPPSMPTEAVRQVLKRRLFVRPDGYQLSHRTVGEYLAARYIQQRVDEGLSPSRVLSLMLDANYYLASNLRGLAGWLATLCEPLSTAILEADPAAVLDYGDLNFLPLRAKQSMIQALSRDARSRNLNGFWRNTKPYLPLVQSDMRDFVIDWFAGVQTKNLTNEQENLAALLLTTLEETPSDSGWQDMLQSLVKDEAMSIGIRVLATSALVTHAQPDVAMGLLDDLQSGHLHDQESRMTGCLLQKLYPQYISPAKAFELLRHHQPSRKENLFEIFWNYDIDQATPDSRLLEFMSALEKYHDSGGLIESPDAVYGKPLQGLATLTVRAIVQLGKTVPVDRLAYWMFICTEFDAPLTKHVVDPSAAQLRAWLLDEHSTVCAVLAEWVRQGTSSWVAQFRVNRWVRPVGLGKFWIQQAQLLDSLLDPAKATDCLNTAVWWANQHDGGMTLEDLFAASASSVVLQAALAPHLVTSLEEKNWQRMAWQQDQKQLTQQKARADLQQKKERFLLEHLEDIRQGKLLNYLQRAAWAESKDNGFLSNEDRQIIQNWRNAHAELDSATRDGFQALLSQLTQTQAHAAVKAHEENQILAFELPCLIAAKQRYASHPNELLNLDKNSTQALATLYLIHHLNEQAWFMALFERHAVWVGEAWWVLIQAELRSAKEIHIPHLHLLKRHSHLASAKQLLCNTLQHWPIKFSERNFPSFSDALKAVLKYAPSELGSILHKRLQRKSLSPLQRAYLLMAGLWVDSSTYAPLLQDGLLQKQVHQLDLLGFVGNLSRYGHSPQTLPTWDTRTVTLLLRQFAPLCSPVHPEGVFSPTSKDSGRDFVFQLLAVLKSDAHDAARNALLELVQEPSLQAWRVHLEDAVARQRQTQAEAKFSIPSPKQVALTLANQSLANTQDFMALAMDALKDLQHEVNNSATNLIHQFWSVDDNGHKAKQPHLPEPTCRDRIAQWLIPRVKPMSISVLPEIQHGDQKRSDIGLLSHTPNTQSLLLPIEVKGDWHPELRTAGYEQLGKLYASDPRCFGQGIYLVLWTGEKVNLRDKAGKKISTAQQLRHDLQEITNDRAAHSLIHVFVLDISI